MGREAKGVEKETERRSARTCISLTPSELNLMRELAEKRGIPLSQLVVKLAKQDYLSLVNEYK